MTRDSWSQALIRIANAIRKVPGLRWFGRLLSRTSRIAEPTDHYYYKPLPNRLPNHNHESITVVSANLWHDWPRYRRLLERLEAFAQLVESEAADILLLQEVSRSDELWADTWLANRLGMAYVYARANGHLSAGGFEEGLAIFSRYRLEEPEIEQLYPQPLPLVRRQAIGATVETPWGPFIAVSAHLGLGQKENSGQISHLRSWISNQGRDLAVVIGGDFNRHEEAEHLQAATEDWIDVFRHVNPAGDGTTHVIRWPWGRVLKKQRLDYLFLQPGQASWQILDARHVESASLAHSDHHAVVARVVPHHPSRQTN